MKNKAKRCGSLARCFCPSAHEGFLKRCNPTGPQELIEHRNSSKLSEELEELHKSLQSWKWVSGVGVGVMPAHATFFTGALIGWNPQSQAISCPQSSNAAKFVTKPCTSQAEYGECRTIDHTLDALRHTPLLLSSIEHSDVPKFQTDADNRAPAQADDPFDAVPAVSKQCLDLERRHTALRTLNRALLLASRTGALHSTPCRLQSAGGQAGVPLPKPCKRTQEKLDELLGGARKHKDVPELFTDYFFRRNPPQHLAHLVVNDDLPRCNECGFPISAHESTASTAKVQRLPSIDNALAVLEAGAKSETGAKEEVSAPTSDDWLSFAMKWCNKDLITAGLEGGIQTILQTFGSKIADKSRQPLMCITATAGQGKTDTLLHIRYDRDLQQQIVGAINTNLKHRNIALTCKRCVPLLATFNQDSTYSVDDEPRVVAALCNRLLCGYLGVEFSSKNNLLFEGVPLAELTELVRKKEAAKHGCKEEEVCVVILVDELRKLPAPTTSKLLDAICHTQQLDVSRRSRLTLPIVTCLDVETIFAQVTTKSKRPLFSIPLHPCSVGDTNEFVENCQKSAEREHPLALKLDLGDPMKRRLTLDVFFKDLLWSAHGTGGHFRSLYELWKGFHQLAEALSAMPADKQRELLEKIEHPTAALKNRRWKLFREHAQFGSALIPTEEENTSVAYLLEIIAKQLAIVPETSTSTVPDPNQVPVEEKLFWMKENATIGTLFSRSATPQTLYQIAMRNTSGVFYRAVDVRRKTVSPCVSPMVLWYRTPCPYDIDVAQNIVAVWRQLFPQLATHPGELIKSWETAVPLLEAVVASLLRVVIDPTETVTLSRVLTGAVVVHWDPANPVTLQYTASCCSECHKILDAPEGGARTAEARSLAADTEAIKKACASTVATLCLAKCGNYPAIEGVHTLLEDGRTSKLCPVVFQMKTSKNVFSKTDGLISWAEKAHKHATDVLDLQPGSYYVALYLKANVSDSGCSGLPPGTIVVGGTTVQRILKPFGATPLLQFLEEENKNE